MPVGARCSINYRRISVRGSTRGATDPRPYGHLVPWAQSPNTAASSANMICATERTEQTDCATSRAIMCVHVLSRVSSVRGAVRPVPSPAVARGNHPPPLPPRNPATRSEWQLLTRSKERALITRECIGARARAGHAIFECTGATGARARPRSRRNCVTRTGSHAHLVRALFANGRERGQTYVIRIACVQKRRRRRRRRRRALADTR